jgi:hypothetical protein
MARPHSAFGERVNSFADLLAQEKQALYFLAKNR